MVAENALEYMQGSKMNFHYEVAYWGLGFDPLTLFDEVPVRYHLFSMGEKAEEEEEPIYGMVRRGETARENDEEKQVGRKMRLGRIKE